MSDALDLVLKRRFGVVLLSPIERDRVQNRCGIPFLPFYAERFCGDSYVRLSSPFSGVAWMIGDAVNEDLLSALRDGIQTRTYSAWRMMLSNPRPLQKRPTDTEILSTIGNFR